MEEKLQELRRYFDSGATRSYAFRREQLLSFKNAVVRYEKEIFDALYSDLKKVPEEAGLRKTGC